MRWFLQRLPADWGIEIKKEAFPGVAIVAALVPAALARMRRGVAQFILPSKSAAVRSFLPLTSFLILALLTIANGRRLFRHAMWGDELQAFMIADASSTPLDLFSKLKYEGHPGLWHLLLWMITRFTDYPFAMQVAQFLIALSIWLLIWYVSPFKPIEKILLLLSYYLFWEYFVLSRSYSLAVLLGFGFVALIVNWPQQRFWPWVLLGLLSNTSVFGTIWAFALAGLFAAKNRMEWRTLVPGAATFAALAVLAIATMVPAAEADLPTAAFPMTNILPAVVSCVVGAFFPFFSPFLHDTLIFFGASKGELEAAFFRNPVDTIANLAASSYALTAGVLVLPILACSSIVRDRALTITYLGTAIGILMFPTIWQYPLAPRHYGFLFVALVGTVWMWRALPSRPISLVWTALITLNALGGLLTFSSELRPYSQSRNAAMWIEKNHLQNDFLIGSPDYGTLAISGYLRRPLYYVDCECFATYGIWRKVPESKRDLEFLAGVARALETQHKDMALLILSYPSSNLAKQKRLRNITIEPVHWFPDAIIQREAYVIYRVKKQSSN